MGWNDRLPEDPYIPYESQDDRDAYENWAMYLEELRAEEEAGGLTSNNVMPEDLDAMTAEDMQEGFDILARLRHLTAEATQRKTDCVAEPQDHNEDQNSRQSAHHQTPAAKSRFQLHNPRR